jgi:two-component system chemotaxis sensor kinase CheA
MDELLAQFIVEARELVQAAIDDLLALDSDPDKAGRLGSVFRAVHTLKGSAGLFDLAVLQTVLHRAEDDLGRVRSSGARLDAGKADALVAILEWVDKCVDDIERDGTPGAPLLARAAPLLAALDVEEDAGATPADVIAAPSIAWALALAKTVGGEPKVALRYRPHPECFFNGDDPIALVSRVPALLHLEVARRDAWPAPERFDPYRSNLWFEALSGGPLPDVEAIFRLVPDQVEIVSLAATPDPSADGAAPEDGRAATVRSLRVDPARIDALLDTVGELMTTKNRVATLVAAATALDGGADLARAIAATQKELDRLAASLHGAVLQTRMVPLAQAFRRLPRMVHDLSRRLGKPTELVIDGDAIEADKAIVDELFEPLLHLVRNAMDHGIEDAAGRVAAGKPAKAILRLWVMRQGDRLVVGIADDGRGIDPEAIRSAAVRKGLATAEQAGRLDDAGALDLLFAAGFSTSADVSDLSGRGVGLDTVRSAIARLGGTVDLTSRVGAGTTITLHLPVSFALTQLLVVSVAGERYGVPMQSVLETVRVRRRAITPIRGNRAFVLRDRTVPLLSLSALLGLDEDAATEEEDLTVLVLALEDQQVGITIDAVAERMETITRPLGGLLTGVRGIAGTTVLGDGRVLLVLDVAGLIG